MAVAAAVAALMIAAAWPGGNAAPVPRLAEMPPGRMAPANVDVELAIAVDVSYSMDPEEQALQRDGYVAALTAPEFLNALKGGMHGRIAVTYFEWAGTIDQLVVVPWRVIDGLATATAFADAIGAAPYRRAFRTSISGALDFAVAQFEESGYRGIRRVIDVSGDGTNNQGPPVDVTRDAVVAKGFTINGLPIMLKRPKPSTLDIEHLDVYYEDCVIGGPAAFVVPIRERAQFKDATRTKLVLEIAGRVPGARVVPAAAAREPRISCLIGERMWRQRWGGQDWN
ncbi:MAG: DUF1194 domain-containing protein [Proteobacteria bacterium]|nr:DUF1194 domain-containing protein [Pseudomonadota bacterium]